MDKLFILLFILVANIVSILLIYHSLDKNIEKTKRLLYTMIAMGVVYIIVLIVYFFSSIGIDKRIATQAKQTIVFTFVPVNSIIVIPFMLRSFNKRKDREITGEQLNKRAVVMFIIAVVIVVSEFFYFRNIEKGIGRIIEQQEAASNTANTTVENLTVENKISNNAVVENSISNTESQVTNDVVSKNMTTKYNIYKDEKIMQKVIVICGPTASGKTALSIELAKKIGGEVVSADSMQIYDEMSIGTAKPDAEEMQGIKHYLVGNIEPTRRYSVSDYKSDAIKALEEIIEKNKTPIVVGGTGLYVNSLIYGIDYPEVETDLEHRKELEKVAEQKGLGYLYEEAKKIDPEAVKNISVNDKKRIIRILEIYKETGKTKTQLEIESRKNGVPYDYRVFAINMPREILYDRINRRVDIMLEKGLIEEVKQLYKKYGDELRTSVQGIGYKEVIDYLNGMYSKEEMIEKIKMETRRYAKRQLTWFRKIPNIIWIDGLGNVQDNVNLILKEAELNEN